MKLLDRLRRSGRASQLRSGPGAAVFQSGFGRIVRFKAQGADFNHPWLMTLLSENSATFLPGAVNGVQAAIKGVPLSGNKKGETPVLRWSKLRLNADGMGWFCAEITCADLGKKDRTPWSVTKVEIVQVADPDTDNGEAGSMLNASGGARPLSDFRARWPVAMIQEYSEGSRELFQIVYFNLTHRVGLKADGVSAARHFFF
ncbi:MAG: hypothetical protein QOE70_5353 [Chthoniobacter sp.]|jgi:hypothetical protein|nr:hypothetical protein [Chthoniobacter sp.]